ncbi:MAG: hypothetical protein Q8R92_17580 [Deltaproteobacteria bacterium]|nr:hypothetical protein [Deltaproteobacteria bacterium]
MSSQQEAEATKTAQPEAAAHYELSAEDILGAEDQLREWVPTPEWKPKGYTGPLTALGVWVHGLSGIERDRFESSLIPEEDPAAGMSRTARRRSMQERKKKGATERQKRMANFRARFCSQVIRDAKGRRIFDGDDGDAQILGLGQKNARVLDRIFEKGRELSGMDDSDVDDLVEAMGEAGAAGGSG